MALACGRGRGCTQGRGSRRWPFSRRRHLWGKGGGRRDEHLHANGHLEAASPGGCRQNVAFQYSREIECHDGSRACGERGAMMSTCMHLHAVARSSALARIPRPSSPSRCPARSPCRRGDGIYRWARTPGRTPSARPAGGRPPRDRRAALQMPRRRAAGGRARSAMGILVRSARGARRSGGVPDEGRTQAQSEAIRGNQKQSEAIRGNQGARVGYLMREALRCHQDTINKQTDPLRWCARRSAGLPNGIVPRACSRPPKASRRAPSGRGASRSPAARPCSPAPKSGVARTARHCAG